MNTLGKHYNNKTAQDKILQNQIEKKQNEQQHSKNRNVGGNEVIIQGRKC